MRYYEAEDIIRRLPYDLMARDLPALLQAEVTAPQRHIHATDALSDAALLLMPAWNRRMGGVKIVNVTPENTRHGRPAVHASYLLFDAETGEHRALLDGGELTARRTAAVAAVAADRLARREARRLLLIGSGRIASELAFAYRAVRPIETVSVYSRGENNAGRLAHALRAGGFQAEPVTDIAAAVEASDIIACATLSQTPLVHGDRVRPGQHVALIGGYTAQMREGDDALMAKAEIWVDTQAALSEAGDLIGPIASGAITAGSIRGTLRQLCAQKAETADRVTVFKSVGDASQDLAAAILAVGSL